MKVMYYFIFELGFPEWAGIPTTNNRVYGKSCFPKYRRPKIVKKGNKYKMVKQESFIKLSFMEKETKPIKNFFNRWIKFAGETHE